MRLQNQSHPTPIPPIDDNSRKDEGIGDYLINITMPKKDVN